MKPILQVGERTVTSEELIPLLGQYQLLPQLLRELVIDQAISSIHCTPEEEIHAWQQFCEQNQLTSDAQVQDWLTHFRISPEQVRGLAVRQLRIEKFKLIAWEPKLEAEFLSRKGQFDRVIYSLLRIQSAEIAQELYFRILAAEQPFAELAREYSQGPEAQTGGLIGPVEVASLHPSLAQILMSSQPGRLGSPTRLGEWWVIVRLEQRLPAQLDAALRQQLLNHLFESWLQAQLQQISVAHPQNPVSILTPQ